jgi:hypothetical protein
MRIRHGVTFSVHCISCFTNAGGRYSLLRILVHYKSEVFIGVCACACVPVARARVCFGSFQTRDSQRKERLY